MENSFFIFTEKSSPVQIDRFHVCTWEFNNNTSLVEFGFEISKDAVTDKNLTISLYIPWAKKAFQCEDLYDKLSIPDNARFIFNDSVIGTSSLDGGRNQLGVIHKFSGRNELCFLPVKVEKKEDKLISAVIDVQSYQEFISNPNTAKPNIYIRFCVKPSFPFVSIRKKGINKSTIIYDIKINERRNIPEDYAAFFRDKEFCKIKYCFSFNILPNKYDIVFFDNSSLKNVRTLEYDSFTKYIDDSRVKKDELIVVFNKKEVREFDPKKNAESFSFFSIYSNERIGPGQFALAILINIICGVLLFIPAFRKTFNPELKLHEIWVQLPIEIYIAFAIAVVTIIYFCWPNIKKIFTRNKNY